MTTNKRFPCDKSILPKKCRLTGYFDVSNNDYEKNKNMGLKKELLGICEDFHRLYGLTTVQLKEQNKLLEEIIEQTKKVL